MSNPRDGRADAKGSTPRAAVACRHPSGSPYGGPRSTPRVLTGLWTTTDPGVR